MKFTEPQRQLLIVLAQADPVRYWSASEVHGLRLGRQLSPEERLGAGKNVSRTLERLAKLGLVEREGGHGRRADGYGYRLSEHGRRTALGLTGSQGTPRRRSAWTEKRVMERTTEERLAILDAAAVLASRVVIPGRDPEPYANAELVDRSGTVWRKDDSHAGDGWAPEGGDDMSLRWSSPAMAAAGPFMRPLRGRPVRLPVAE